MPSRSILGNAINNNHISPHYAFLKCLTSSFSSAAPGWIVPVETLEVSLVIETSSRIKQVINSKIKSYLQVLRSHPLKLPPSSFRWRSTTVPAIDLFPVKNCKRFSSML